ncbi:DinB family protein [Salinicoccus sp. ID82-1]|uniref:DinB family protein n=1 Tax=Salinicoccus sp. ID82-1 TaxID=2820269 RepID=UPI001F2AF0C6|nr:DinB family protein [Salinicoccus sp. ID82-1]MCG1008821.1 DinB family protein [Salinicoccus sp. ID82-1]
MEVVCQSVLKQIKVAVDTLVEIIDTLEESDLQKRPTEGKFSIGEMLEHTALICEADWRISNSATQKEMEEFYTSFSLMSLVAIKEELLHGYDSLEKNYSNLSNEQLLEKTSAYWGVTYTRYEWLLEILTHIFHHRGQLHAMLVHCYAKDPNLMLFE